MVNRIIKNSNALDISNQNALDIGGGVQLEKSKEMLSIEGLKCQLVELQMKGDRIIMEATDEIQKRNACLKEGLAIMGRVRQVLIKGADVDTLTQLFEDIDRWMGPIDSGDPLMGQLPEK